MIQEIDDSSVSFPEKSCLQALDFRPLSSAHWFGQALVDIPLHFFIFLLMQMMDYIFSPDEIIFIIQSQLIQVSGKNCEVVLLDYLS